VKQLWDAFLRKALHFRDDSDIQDELRAHLEMQMEDYIATGISKVEAERRARLMLGRTTGIIEALWDAEFVTFLEGGWQDLVFALKILRK
jgi:hypothetical protein